MDPLRALLRPVTAEARNGGRPGPALMSVGLNSEARKSYRGLLAEYRIKDQALRERLSQSHGPERIRQFLLMPSETRRPK